MHTKCLTLCLPHSKHAVSVAYFSQYYYQLGQISWVLAKGMQAEVQSLMLRMPSLRRALRSEAFQAPDIWWFLALAPPPFAPCP